MKLTKKILEQLIKEEITKVNEAKDFERQFSSFLKNIPILGSVIDSRIKRAPGLGNDPADRAKDQGAVILTYGSQGDNPAVENKYINNVLSVALDYVADNASEEAIEVALETSPAVVHTFLGSTWHGRRLQRMYPRLFHKYGGALGHVKIRSAIKFANIAGKTLAMLEAALLIDRWAKMKAKSQGMDKWDVENKVGAGRLMRSARKVKSDTQFLNILKNEIGTDLNVEPDRNLGHSVQSKLYRAAGILARSGNKNKILMRQGLMRLRAVIKNDMGFYKALEQLKLLKRKRNLSKEERIIKQQLEIFVSGDTARMNFLKPMLEQSDDIMAALRDRSAAAFDDLDDLERQIARANQKQAERMAYEKTVSEGVKFAKKLLRNKDFMENDPCLKKQKTKSFFNSMLKSLSNLSAKDLTFIENTLYEQIELSNMLMSDMKEQMVEHIEIYEEIEQTFEDVRRGDYRSEEAQDMRDNIDDGRMGVEEYLELQKYHMDRANFGRKVIRTYQCRIKNFNNIAAIAANLSGDKYQAQSDEEQKLKIMAAIETETGYVVKLSNGKTYNVPYEKVAEFKKKLRL